LRVLRDLRLVEFTQVKKNRHYSLAMHVSIRGRGKQLRLGLDTNDGVRVTLLMHGRTAERASPHSNGNTRANSRLTRYGLEPGP
jgi:hypothetical protein